jgi:hypothetical protein
VRRLDGGNIPVPLVGTAPPYPGQRGVFILLKAGEQRSDALPCSAVPAWLPASESFQAPHLKTSPHLLLSNAVEPDVPRNDGLDSLFERTKLPS